MARERHCGIPTSVKPRTMTRKLSTLTSSTIMTKYQFMGITSYTSYSVIPYCHPVNMTNKCSKVSVSLDTKFVIHVLSCLFLFLVPLICPFIQCIRYWDTLVSVYAGWHISCWLIASTALCCNIWNLACSF